MDTVHEMSNFTFPADTLLTHTHTGTCPLTSVLRHLALHFSGLGAWRPEPTGCRHTKEGKQRDTKELGVLP